MTTSADSDARHDHPETPARPAWTSRANVVFWALLFGTVVLVAADPILRDRVADNAADSPFASEAIFLTVLKVATFVTALLLALLQAWVYGLVLALATALPRPPLMIGWGYVLVAQAPMVLVIGGAYLLAGADAVADAQAVWVRVLLGLTAVVIYAYLAARDRQVERSRLLAFVVLAAAVNSAMLLLQPSAR